MLDQSEIVSYLLSLGIVKPKAIVDGDLMLVDASRRNRVFVAITGLGPTYVVKLARPETVETVAREAATLQALAEMPELAAHVPVVAHYDARAACLVTSSPSRALDWIEHHRKGRFPRAPARTLGRVLAALHATPPSSIGKGNHDVHHVWGLSLCEPSYESVLAMSPGARQLVARVQASPTMCDRLRSLQADSDAESLVHGDLRCVNYPATTAPGASRRTRVTLIDWELAGPGSAAYD